MTLFNFILNEDEIKTEDVHKWFNKYKMKLTEWGFR